MTSQTRVSSSIGVIKQVRPLVSMHTAFKIYKGLIKPHLITVVLSGMACCNSRVTTEWHRQSDY